MARSAAALVYGYLNFDPRVRVAGVVLNRVGSDTHEKMLREALGPLGVPVLGVLRRDAHLKTPDRHLGLVPVAERREEAGSALDRLGVEISRSCDLEGIIRLARSAGPLHAEPWNPEASEPARQARIAVAGGPAFSFVYEENMELLRGAGAETILFDPVSDKSLPENTDALYIGGGFPETHAEALSANEQMRDQVREFCRSGRPVVAECGGLLYLVRDLDGHEMCGVSRRHRPDDGSAEARLPGGEGARKLAAYGRRDAHSRSRVPLLGRRAVRRSGNRPGGLPAATPRRDLSPARSTPATCTRIGPQPLKFHGGWYESPPDIRLSVARR